MRTYKVDVTNEATAGSRGRNYASIRGPSAPLKAVSYWDSMTEPTPTSKLTRHSDVGASRLVRLSEYRCPSDKGAPVAVEQFSEATISIVRSGSFGFRSDRDDQLLATGFLLLANPGQCYEISHDQCGGDNCVIFRFDEAVLEEISGPEARSQVRWYFSRSVLPPIPRANALLQLLDQRFPIAGLEEIGLALATCVLERTSAHPRRVAPPLRRTRRSRDTVFAALEHIERTADKELSLAELARVVGLSPYHFLRMFKRETGVTPHRFLMQTRIRNAIALLKEANQSITEVALAVGFGDLSNFINVFTREVGCSPSKFRVAGPRNWATTLKLRPAGSAVCAE